MSLGGAPLEPSQRPKVQATAEVYLSGSDGVPSRVLGSERRYWDYNVKQALGIGGFPLKLTLNQIEKKGVSRSILSAA